MTSPEPRAGTGCDDDTWPCRAGPADQAVSSTHGAATVAGYKWLQVFAGDEAQLRVLRRWLAALLPGCAARDDVVSVAVELATNAVRWTASGRGGWFTVEITWFAETVRVAVTDGGAPTDPHVIEDPLGEHGRGLLLVRALYTRIGVCGDYRGRLVWADVPWTGDGVTPARPCPGAFEAAIHHDETALAQRFAAIPVWFGRSTLQWWALLGLARGGELVTAPSAQELAEVVDRMLRSGRGRPGRPSRAVDPEAARAGHRAAVPVAPVPPRIKRVGSCAWPARCQPC